MEKHLRCLALLSVADTLHKQHYLLQEKDSALTPDLPDSDEGPA